MQILWPSLELQPTITWNQSFCPAVNLAKVWDQVHQATGRNVARKRTGAALIIDVVWSGCCKVLGKGKLPAQPVVVKAKSFSRRAQEKNWVVGVMPPGNSKPGGGRRSDKCQRVLHKTTTTTKQQQCFVSSQNLQRDPTCFPDEMGRKEMEKSGSMDRRNLQHNLYHFCLTEQGFP